MAFVIARHVVACTCVLMLVRFPRCGEMWLMMMWSGRVAHGIAARRRSEYAKPNFSYITLIPRSQMSVSVEYPERDREDSGVPAPAERLRPFQKPSTPRNHKPAF
jgi:hypothetical protein